jgi:hypothetical protein
MLNIGNFDLQCQQSASASTFLVKQRLMEIWQEIPDLKKSSGGRVQPRITVRTRTVENLT